MSQSYKRLPKNLQQKLDIKEPPPTLTAYGASWQVIAGRRSYYRSLWEYHYALYLQLLKERGKIREWEHEPDTFWFLNIKRGVRSYLPDFKVTHLNGNIEYCEVKGFMDPKSVTKLKRMAKYYPEVKIRVVDKEWFRQNNKALTEIIPDYNKHKK